jgi:homocysteine S-methyltransferase
VDPQAVQMIHECYIQHGAQVIQTSTYQTSENSVQKWFPEEIYEQVVTKSIDLAYNAKADREVFIAGSIGPYGASLANGAEYTGNYNDISDDFLEAFHKTRLDILCQDDRVDLIALETIPNAQEIKVLTKMMNERQKPYYISLSVKGDTLADGTPLQELKELILQGKGLQCVGVNCLGLSDSLLWLTKLKPWGKGLVVYPNSGEIYEDRAWHEPSKEDRMTWEQYVESLHEIGNVKIIGGCCRTTPEIIGELSRAVERIHC